MEGGVSLTSPTWLPDETLLRRRAWNPRKVALEGDVGESILGDFRCPLDIRFWP